MVHCGMLPRPRRHLDNRECRRRAQGAPQGCQTVGGGDFNVNLVDPEGDRRGEDIAAVMETESLEDMLVHFLPRRRSW